MAALIHARVRYNAALRAYRENPTRATLAALTEARDAYEMIRYAEAPEERREGLRTERACQLGACYDLSAEEATQIVQRAAQRGEVA